MPTGARPVSLWWPRFPFRRCSQPLVLGDSVDANKPARGARSGLGGPPSPDAARPVRGSSARGQGQ